MARAESGYWSADVTKHSDALDLEEGVFTFDSTKKIAQSLKRSAEASKRRKGSPYQSAMSMLTFYINRAGDNLPDKQRKVLEKDKDELREAFGRED
jgi:putative cell wall-binding protein